MPDNLMFSIGFVEDRAKKYINIYSMYKKLQFLCIKIPIVKFTFFSFQK